MNTHIPVQIDVDVHTVDYGMDFDDMVSAGGYDWDNKDITDQLFPIDGDGKVEFEDRIFCFTREMSSEDVVREILATDTENPWQPARIENLLAYGTKNLETQWRLPIVCLGSVGNLNGRHYVAYLRTVRGSRCLSLRWKDGKWSAGFCFLAVRRRSSRTQPAHNVDFAIWTL